MTNITKTIEAMRQAAEAVPEDERVWGVDSHGDVIATGDGPYHIGNVACQVTAWEADYIAAASPANVLRVLDAFDKTVALLHELTQAINDCAPEPPRD